MVVTVSRKELLPALSMIGGVIERKQTLPILGNVLVKVTNGKMHLIATDLELEIRTVSPITGGDDEFAFTIPAKKFGDICKSLPDGEIKITVDADKASIRSGRSNFTLGTLPAADYPSLEMAPAAITFTIESGLLQQLLERTAFSIAHNDARYYLNGLLFDFSKNHSSLSTSIKGRDGKQRLRCVGTDGHRMAVCDTVLDFDIGDKQIVIPRKAVLELVRMLDDSDSKITVEISVGFCRFRVGETVFTTKLIDGKFPEYQRVIPKNLEKSALVDREALRRALLRASILSHERYQGIKLLFEPGKDGASGILYMETSNAELEDAKEEMDVDYQGDESGIAFNVHYMLDVLGAINCKLVAIDFVDGISSAVYRDPDDTNRLYVIMPMRL